MSIRAMNWPNAITAKIRYLRPVDSPIGPAAGVAAWVGIGRPPSMVASLTSRLLSFRDR